MRKITTMFVALIATTALWAYDAVVDGIYYNLTGDSATVTSQSSYSSSTPSYSGTVIIPATFTYENNTYRVTCINSDAFRNCSTLTAITIPTSMQRIGDVAFQGCSTLSTIYWNAINCTSISYSEPRDPFSGTPVSNIIFGSEVQSIPAKMFSGLAQLTSVTIPENITSIGGYAFGNCPNLKTVFWNAKNGTRETDIYSSGRSPFGTYSGSGRTLLNNIIFGDKVERIPAYLCSSQKDIQSISLPASLKHIDDNAFVNCSGLTSLVIPDQVTTIGDQAFAGCNSLENLLIGNSVDSIGRNAFESCVKLTKVTIPQSIRFVGDQAFASNMNLKYFEVKNPDAYCDYLVLSNCTAIETIIGPSSLFNFPTEYMMYLDIQPYTATYIQVNGGELEETGCLSITHNYKRLRSLDVAGATNTTLTDEAFMGCYNVEELKLPSQLERVPYMAVAGCKFLKSIDIPASVVEIEPSAFEDCRSIQTITFGGAAKSPARMQADATSALKKIGNWAFYNAHELQNLTIPEGVEEIGDGAFYGCTYLEDLVLPSTVSEIGDNCFSLCSKMKKISVTSTTPPTIYAKTFYDVNRAIPVYVPDEAVDNYKNDTYWKEFDIRGGATGLNQLTDSPVNRFTKIVKDGQLLILRDSKTYNAQGAEVR